MDASNFPARLKELREERGLTQKELAQMAGVGQQSIANWEQGIADPTLGKVISLANALGCCIKDFCKPPAERPKAGRGRPRKEE